MLKSIKGELNNEQIAKGIRQQTLAGNIAPKFYGKLIIASEDKQATEEGKVLWLSGKKSQKQAQTRFSASFCVTNGIKQNLIDYLIQNQTDLRCLLLANYSSVILSVSFHSPITSSIESKCADPVEGHISGFQKTSFNHEKFTLSCNCVLNYLYSKWEYESAATITGPMLFEGFVYHLLNQVLVYWAVEEAE